MWYKQHNLMHTGSIDSIRHMCDNSHNNLVYGYIEHDTVNYGHQMINDGKNNGFTLQTIFLRPNNDESTDWTTRIIYETNNSASSVSLVWYVYIDPGDEQPSNKEDFSVNIFQDVNNILDKSLATIVGHTQSLNDFKMSIIPLESNNNENSSQFTISVNTSITNMYCPNAAMLKQCLTKSMIIKQQTVKKYGTQILLVDENNNDKRYQMSKIINNFVAIQVTITHNSIQSSKIMSKLKNLSYSFDVAYTQKHRKINTAIFKNTYPSLIGNTFNLMHAKYSKQFQQKFENTFPIIFKQHNTEKDLLLTFAKVTFSNMAGSIGYFYGSSLVRDDDNYNNNRDGVSDAVKYWQAGLLTAVPSRSQFPRGFLWDDGFHGLLLGSWSIELQLNILGHWMDLLNYQGWIPREQVRKNILYVGNNIVCIY